MKYILLSLVCLSLFSCEDDKIYQLDETCQCPPIEAPTIELVYRTGDELYLSVLGAGDQWIDLKRGKSDYEIVDIGFWSVERFPFTFHRVRNGDKIDEYIIYYGERIDVR